MRAFPRKTLKTAAVAAVILYALPTFALAAALPAGFAPGTLWLSKTDIVGGDNVTLYTVVYDSSQTPIDGTVSFSVDNAALGAAHFSLTAGESAIASVPWKAVAGTHALSAQVEHVVDHATNAALSVSSATTGSLSVTVAAPPPPPVAVQYLAGAASVAQSAAEAATPFAKQVADAVLNTAEAVRQSGVSALTNTLAQSADANAGGMVLGTTSERFPAAAAVAGAHASGNSSSGTTAQITRLLETTLLFIFESPFLFTIFAIVVGLLCFWLLFGIFGRLFRRR